MQFHIVTNWRMAITKMAFIFQMHYATPIIRLLIGVISNVKVFCNYLSVLNEVCIVTNWRMANTMVTIVFQNSYATPLIRLLIRVITDLKVFCNYLSDLNEILYSDQLED